MRRQTVLDPSRFEIVNRPHGFQITCDGMVIATGGDPKKKSRGGSFGALVKNVWEVRAKKLLEDILHEQAPPDILAAIPKNDS